MEAVGVTREPEISVVVASHDRPYRLRWLLNALEEQTLDRDRWEVIVAHDSRGPETEALLREHPLPQLSENRPDLSAQQERRQLPHDRAGHLSRLGRTFL